MSELEPVDWTPLMREFARPPVDWEERFDALFYEGLYGCAESDGEYYDVFEAVKAFIRELLERST